MAREGRGSQETGEGAAGGDEVNNDNGSRNPEMYRKGINIHKRSKTEE